MVQIGSPQNSSGGNSPVFQALSDRVNQNNQSRAPDTERGNTPTRSVETRATEAPDSRSSEAARETQEVQTNQVAFERNIRAPEPRRVNDAEQAQSEEQSDEQNLDNRIQERRGEQVFRNIRNSASFEAGNTPPGTSVNQVI